MDSTVSVPMVISNGQKNTDSDIRLSDLVNFILSVKNAGSSPALYYFRIAFLFEVYEVNINSWS